MEENLKSEGSLPVDPSTSKNENLPKEDEPVFSLDPYGKKIISWDQGQTWSYLLEEVVITSKKEDPSKT